MKRAFTKDQTWLQCMDCGYRADLLNERFFRCPKCQGLYDIHHDLNPPLKALARVYELERPDLTYKRVFDFRAGKGTSWSGPVLSSGVWRFKELIMPYLPEKHIISLQEGNVPIVRAGKYLRQWVGDSIDLYIILEGQSPTGSFKDFGGTVMMSIAKAAGIEAVCCASTGDTSAMAAAYAAAANIRCAVLLPKGKVTPAQLVQPLIYGARVITLPGDFDDCMRVMQHLVTNYRIYPANSLNPSRIEGHQVTVFLIAQNFEWELPDWIAVPVGNGSNCSSVGKGLRLMSQVGFKVKTKILGCQSQAANPLALSWKNAISIQEWQNAYKSIKVGETTATAARIGNPVSCKKVMREITLSNGEMQTASEKDLNEAVAICGRDGYFVCPQTGIALAGVKNAVRDGQIQKNERVVVVSTATGLKFTDSASNNLKKEIISAPSCKTETVLNLIMHT
ncbi:threonine synthase [Candidatus Falkowbacteria bacterium]|nr:threonine synthase [Candidatus Falkowbacteria bacterium]